MASPVYSLSLPYHGLLPRYFHHLVGSLGFDYGRREADVEPFICVKTLIEINCSRPNVTRVFRSQLVLVLLCTYIVQFTSGAYVYDIAFFLVNISPPLPTIPLGVHLVARVYLFRWQTVDVYEAGSDGTELHFSLACT